jgi:hypothetical protein
VEGSVLALWVSMARVAYDSVRRKKASGARLGLLVTAIEELVMFTGAMDLIPTAQMAAQALSNVSFDSA